MFHTLRKLSFERKLSVFFVLGDMPDKDNQNSTLSSCCSVILVCQVLYLLIIKD
jgi:hypothetical protein